MPFRVGSEVTVLIGRARVALGLTQKSLGTLLGSSIRTAHRWEGGRSTPTLRQVKQLAQAVYPVDPELAGELAEAGGTTLEALGLVVAPVAVAAPPLPPSRAFPPVALIVDSIVLASVDASDGQVTRQIVRDILRAGFTRARGLGLTIDEVDDVLASTAAAKAPPAKR